MALRTAGVPVQTLACVEDSIDQEGLVHGGVFLHQTLSTPPGHRRA
jgi:hypothetical protein